MKVVTICGSMKFAGEMQSIAANLQIKNGWCILQPVYFSGELKQSEVENLKNAHFKKIDLSDAIYVVNINGYIGSSTKNEIEYAGKLGKEVIYHEK